MSEEIHKEIRYFISRFLDNTLDELPMEKCIKESRELIAGILFALPKDEQIKLISTLTEIIKKD